MNSQQRTGVAIVGAGLSGLMAAAVLTGRGHSVTLIDKGRSVGGRLATRRIGGGRADHGAQFFTVRHAAFAEWVERWRAEELVYIWSNGWSDGSLSAAEPDGHPRYAVRGGMNALAKHLADQVTRQGAVIHTGEPVSAVAAHDQGWRISTGAGHVLDADAVVLTAPAPQSLALLDAGHIVLDNADRAALARIRYWPCLCGLFVVAGDVALPAPGAVQRPERTAAWIADNQRKGISPGARVVTLHAGGAWSEAHYADDDDAVAAALRIELEPWLGEGAGIVEWQVKRWRYAAPAVLHPMRMLRLALHAPLYAGGDAFFEPRVEGAALSGMTIGAALAEELDSLRI